jgi:PKHD-type hydroxylase
MEQNIQPRDNNYWFWKAEISHENCQKIINLSEDNWNEASTFASEVDIQMKVGVRKSDIVWITEQWVYDLIWGYMCEANENAGWKYNIIAAESCQITRYTKGGFYSWHRDGIGAHNAVSNLPNNKFLHGNARKLSMSILLNDDYEGGDFQVHGDSEHGEEVPMTTISGEGSVIVFPSFIDHQVTSITKGIRYSLVTWFVGPPFV